MIFSGAITYAEASTMDLAEFEECCQARLQWQEAREREIARANAIKRRKQ